MIAPLLAVAASAVVWALVYRALVRHPLDAMALVLYYLALQLVWRPLVLAVGLDSPFPTLLFQDRDTELLLLRGQAVVVLFLVALWAGARLTTPLVRPVSVLFPQLRGPLPPRVLVVLAVVLSAAAAAATVALWLRYGGPSGLLQASKVDRSLTDSRALRTLPLLAALLGVAAWFSVRGAGLPRLLLLGLVALNGYLSWTWGARDVPVLSAIALLAGALIFGRTGRRAARRPDGQWLRDPRWRLRFLLVPVLALALAFSLRAARDTVLWGDLAPTIEGQGTVRQVAVATNNTFYDALLLYLDDWPDRFDFTGGADFVDGSVAAVPSVLSGPQEPFVSPAVQLAQTYIDRNNGFPATPVGDWYVNLGYPGIVLGGLLSGLVARAGQFAFRRFLRDPLVWGFSLVFMIRVFPGGVWATSAPKWVAIGLPLLAFTVLLNLFLRRGRDGDEAGATAPPAGEDAADGRAVSAR
ncbi:hypothetical protein E9529_18560 [Blastococcus sp. KM273128]|uniref:hypothetical protein n=1 Tax=Blastococcus sp. KM273128 TaxID=2570314 RepID=UPI001F43E3BA|nr:hypothetical protein [Blastococcus sp. KM273128]MCF6746239.1 hypothetical protein [Blastococcus sp. KM273128]